MTRDTIDRGDAESFEAALPPMAPLQMPRQVLEARGGTMLRAMLSRLILPDA